MALCKGAGKQPNRHGKENQPEENPGRDRQRAWSRLRWRNRLVAQRADRGAAVPIPHQLPEAPWFVWRAHSAAELVAYDTTGNWWDCIRWRQVVKRKTPPLAD